MAVLKKIHRFVSWSNSYGRLAQLKNMKVFSILIFFVNYSFVKYMKVISTSVLWNTWKWFQHWSCEIHESDFSNGFVNWPVCEIHESDFNIGLCEIHESDFRYMLWNTWKWFQQWFCEIHESDFSDGFVKYMKVISILVLFSRWTTNLWNTWKWFQNWFREIHGSDVNIGFVKYMKVISILVLWNTWKWFQQWCCEIHESDFSNGFVNWPVC